MRGMVNYWRYADKFWHYVASPINALMVCSDPSNTWIRCDNDQIRLAFWNVITIIRQFGTCGEAWECISTAKLAHAISVPNRIAPEGKWAVFRATGDAVPERFASFNWERREFTLEDAREYLSKITPTSRGTIIGDTELLAERSIVVAWRRPNILSLLGAYNRNVSTWTKRGYEKKGTALLLNPATSSGIATRKCQVEGVYVRSGHNISPEWMARTPSSQVGEWATRDGFGRVFPRPMWGELMVDRLTDAL